MSDFAEGQTATNPATGAKLVYRGGGWHNATAADNTSTDTIVKALVDGRMSFPTDSRALNKPYWQNLLTKVSERDPTFDTIDYKARARTRQDFTSGKSVQNITSFNTLLHHIGTLQKAADDLDNFGGIATPLNAPSNYLLESGGSARPTNFRQAKLAVVGEAVRAFRGVGGARGDIEEAVDAIPENGSPEQIRGSIKTLASLLEGRIKSLGEQYGAGMGKTSNGINLLDDDARKTLAQLGIGQPEDGDSTAAAGPGAGTPPAGPNGAPPTFDGSTTELVRGDQAGGQPAADYTPEQRAAIAAVARTGTGEHLKALLASFGRSFTGTEDELAKALAFYRDPKNASRPVNLPAPSNAVVLNDAEKQEVAQFVEGSDAAGAGMAGVANGATLSFLDETGAAAEAAFGSGEGSFVDRYGRRLAVNRAKLGGLREDNGAAFVAGEVLGSLPLGFGQFANGQAAARAAGVAAMRGGATGAEARVIANRVLAARNAIEGAGLSGAYGAGAADGGIGDRLASGAIGAVAGGLTAGAVTLGGGRFARAMAARRGGAATAAPTEAQLFGEAAQRRGVDYLPADVPGANATRMASGVAHMSLAGLPMSDAATRALASAKRAKDVVADSIGVVGDVTQAGQAAQRGAKSFVTTTEARANNLYEAIPIGSTTDATIANTRNTLADLTAGLESNPELSALVDDPRLKAFEAAFAGRTETVPTGLLDAAGTPVTQQVQRGGSLSWQDLKAFRTYIGERLGGPQLQSDTSRNALKALYGSLSTDMEATAAAQGPNALKAFRRANSYYRGRQNRIEGVLAAVLGDDLAKSPDAAYRAMEALASKRGGDTIKYARLMRSLPDDDANMIRATALDRLGLASAGKQDVTQQVYSPAEFMTQWSKLSERAKASLFTGEHREAVNDLVRIADGMKGSTKYANTSKTSLGYNALATLGTFWTNPLLGIVSPAGQLAVGKLLSSRRVAQWLARAPKKPNLPARKQHVAALSAIARAEPAIANDVLALQSRLLDAFGQGAAGSMPARIAAEETPDEPGDPANVVDRQYSEGATANQRLQPR
ncbi:hypothetical protein GCM10022268_24010 [Sphingomonas cynarae]|uniref:Uncharacterized protein n=1 Tax=Sphingomonas cynarae TaxID=930197 RepID=A0ABP7E558_9SPHN